MTLKTRVPLKNPITEQPKLSNSPETILELLQERVKTSNDGNQTLTICPYCMHDTCVCTVAGALCGTGSRAWSVYDTKLRSRLRLLRETPLKRPYIKSKYLRKFAKATAKRRVSRPGLGTRGNVSEGSEETPVAISLEAIGRVWGYEPWVASAWVV